MGGHAKSRNCSGANQYREKKLGETKEKTTDSDWEISLN